MKINISVFLISACALANAGSISFVNLDPQGGTATDAGGFPLTINGLAASQPADVSTPAGGPYAYTHSFSIAGIDATTGLSGGSDTLSFDVTWTSNGSFLNFLSSSQIRLSDSAPLTVSVSNISLSGGGAISFSDWDNAFIRSHDDPAETVTIYEGTDPSGTILISASGDSGQQHKTHLLTSANPNITIAYGGTGANLGNLAFSIGSFEDGTNPFEPRDISALHAIASNRFPRGIAFRSTENSLIGGLYVVDENLEFVVPSQRIPLPPEQFVSDMFRYDVIVGKMLEEEKTGTAPALAGFNQLKLAHPEKAVLMHFNGQNRRPELRIDGEEFFPGHYLYQTANEVISNLSADFGTTVIELDDVSDYVDGSNQLIPEMEFCLFAVVNGTPDFSQTEYVFATAVDVAGKTLTISRGENGSTPRAFTGGQTRIARAAVKTGRWHYNWSPTSPLDAQGRTCGEALADEIVYLYGDGGELQGIDGVVFDAATVHRANVEFGGDVDLDMDGTPELLGFDSSGVYLPLEGYTQFSKALREAMGQNFLLVADSRTPRHHRSFAYYNGTESEGWPQGGDLLLFKQWSSGVARHQFLDNRLVAPAFHHFHPKVAAPVDNLRRLAHAAACCLNAGYTSEYRSFEDTGEIVGHQDEMCQGIAFDFNGWLGEPLGDMVRIADEATNDLTNGAYSNLAFTPSVDVTTDNITGLPLTKLTLSGIPNPGEELYLKFKVTGDAMAGYDPTIPRVCRLKMTPTGSTKFTIDSSTLTEITSNPRYDEQEFYVDPTGETFGFYFRWLNTTTVDLEFAIEGHDPAVLESFEAYEVADIIYREFENGLVICNPSLNPITFDLAGRFPGQSFRKINGYFDPVYNDGAILGNNVSIPALNALFLIKGGADDATAEKKQFLLDGEAPTLITGDFFENPSGDPLRMSFKRRALEFAPLGADYVIETSPTLLTGSWDEIDPDANLFESISDGVYETLTVDLPGISRDDKERFFRLRIDR